jgi:hypothetical protein
MNSLCCVIKNSVNSFMIKPDMENNLHYYVVAHVMGLEKYCYLCNIEIGVKNINNFNSMLNLEDNVFRLVTTLLQTIKI